MYNITLYRNTGTYGINSYRDTSAYSITPTPTMLQTQRYMQYPSPKPALRETNPPVPFHSRLGRVTTVPPMELKGESDNFTNGEQYANELTFVGCCVCVRARARAHKSHTYHLMGV